MRTIKFRGKHVSTGEWCYGYYCEQNIPEYDNDIPGHVNGYTKLPMVFNDEPGQNHGKGYWTEVKYNTVGQCTSLRDKNGRDIYEGDIIKAGNENDLLEVRFVRGVFAFLWNGDLDSEFPCNAPTQEWAEIVGNIHDNPGMIKKPAWSEEVDKMVKDIIAAIDTLHYHGRVEAEDALEDHLGRGSKDLELVIGKLNSYLLKKFHIQGRFKVLPHMTLSQLLNQINDLQNGKV